MQIMTILGSPRRQGNTAKVLGWIEQQDPRQVAGRGRGDGRAATLVQRLGEVAPGICRRRAVREPVARSVRGARRRVPAWIASGSCLAIGYHLGFAQSWWNV